MYPPFMEPPSHLDGNRGLPTGSPISPSVLLHLVCSQQSGHTGFTESPAPVKVRPYHITAQNPLMASHLIHSKSQGPPSTLEAPHGSSPHDLSASSPTLLPMSFHSSHLPPAPSLTSASFTPRLPHVFTQKLLLRDSLPDLT